MSKKQTNTLLNYFQSPKFERSGSGYNSQVNSKMNNIIKDENLATSDNEDIVSRKRKRLKIGDSSDRDSKTPQKYLARNSKTDRFMSENEPSNKPKRSSNIFLIDSDDSDDELKHSKKSKQSQKEFISKKKFVLESDDSDYEPEKVKKNLKDVSVQKSKSNGQPKQELLRKKVIINTELSDDELSTKKTLKDLCFQKSISSIISKQEPDSPESSQFISFKPIEEQKDIKDIYTSWMHNNLEFLKPDKIMDINKRKPTDPDYDPRTLYVPESFVKDLTPVMKQWWEMKSRHMDTVLFFKVGKFYELYHMDAVIGVSQLELSYMKGNIAHSGFPETAYSKMANSLLQTGYKVGRVEQTETPEMMADRCKKTFKPTKYDKVVNREMCQISTKATCAYNAQMPDAPNELPNYLFAVCTKRNSFGNCRVGLCFMETSIGTIHLAEFDDDKYFSSLLAIFAEYPVALILTERHGMEKNLSELLSTHLGNIRRENLASKTQFYLASDTLQKFSTECYFRDKYGNFHWPEFFKRIADDCLPKPDYEQAIRSLGACLWYLKHSKLDIYLLSMQKFEWYDPLDMYNKQELQREFLILDADTISNLALLGSEGTLQKTLNHCDTPFGKRLLRRWICRPLCDVEKIKERQKAVEELCSSPSLLGNAQATLKNMPDLERLLAKIHSYGNRFIAAEHPDSRATFYEAATYSKRKIHDFIKTLNAFKEAQQIAKIFEDAGAPLLKKITQFNPKGMNIDLSETLDFFKRAFNQAEAEKEGKIIPNREIDQRFDDAENKIKNINKQLNEYLEEQSKFFGCKLNYFGSDRKRFQLDVPESQSHKATYEYHLESTGKGDKKRYSTTKTKELLAQMIKAEGDRAKIILNVNRKIFEKFIERHHQFDQVIKCLTELDVLCSLSEFARTYSQDICIPSVEPYSKQPHLIIKNGRHPCISNIDSFVPNNTKLGVGQHPSYLILTGPNMGGKSTLMRQIAVICIMAQMGSYVPATSCQLSLINRIFTRLGAQDDIMENQSTFYVELSEASSILKHATQNSLAIIDELGRGTSTHDGNAIATAFVKKLSSIGCRTVFSTHYHSLVDYFVGKEEVQLGHMACMGEKDEDPTQESVTFLYKLMDGRCAKSYGFNAARLAGLDHRIVERGRKIAKRLEEENTLCNILNNVVTLKDISEIRNDLSTIPKLLV